MSKCFWNAVNTLLTSKSFHYVFWNSNNAVSHFNFVVLEGLYGENAPINLAVFWNFVKFTKWTEKHRGHQGSLLNLLNLHINLLMDKYSNVFEKLNTYINVRVVFMQFYVPVCKLTEFLWLDCSQVSEHV